LLQQLAVHQLIMQVAVVLVDTSQVVLLVLVVLVVVERVAHRLMELLEQQIQVAAVAEQVVVAFPMWLVVQAAQELL
jgi:hypothetical protein